MPAGCHSPAEVSHPPPTLGVHNATASAAAAGNTGGETSALTDIGTYSTSTACDVDDSGAVTIGDALDVRYAITHPSAPGRQR